MTTPRAALRLLLATAVVLPLLVACSSSKTDPYDVTDIGRFSLPFERNVSAHPDSLRYVRVVEHEQTVDIQTEQSFRTMAREWSATRRNSTGAAIPGRVIDYATFWGMDLSVLSLEVEMGVSSLSKDQALRIIEQRKDEVRNQIQIDVYWFAPLNARNVPGPNANAEIRVGDGERYKAASSDYGPIRDSFLPDGTRVLYRRCTFFFDRVQDDKDILADATSLRLDVRRFSNPIDDTFIWTWEEAVKEQSRATARRTE
jgi:hypothetical protein